MEQKADAIIRGLSRLSDFEFEFNMALMKQAPAACDRDDLCHANEQYSYTSSTLVKQVARYGGQVAQFRAPKRGGSAEESVREMTGGGKVAQRLRLALLAALCAALAPPGAASALGDAISLYTRRNGLRPGPSWRRSSRRTPPMRRRPTSLG